MNTFRHYTFSWGNTHMEERRAKKKRKKKKMMHAAGRRTQQVAAGGEWRRESRTHIILADRLADFRLVSMNSSKSKKNC